MNDYQYRIVDLIKRYYTEEITSAEQDELLRWVAERPENRVFFESVVAEEESEREQFRKIDLQQALRQFDRKIGYRFVSSGKRWLAYAAGLFLPVLLAVSLYWLRTPETEPLPVTLGPGKHQAVLILDGAGTFALDKEEIHLPGIENSKETGELIYTGSEFVSGARKNTLKTPVGGEYNVTLSDGTVVYLNASSTLIYQSDFQGEDRMIHLEGEAYFEVTPGSRPFIVQTALGEIKVLGTSFNVCCYPEDNRISTTLLTGKVLYTGADSLVMLPGEHLVATSSGEVSKKAVNPEAYIGWIRGKFIFDDLSLEEIMKTLGRWYDITVSFRSPELRQLIFNGNVERYSNINSFLELLKSTGEINYRIDKHHIEFY